MENDLNRFLTAQSADYEQALAEIRDGEKKSHWIWYVFPQLKGLGFSGNASYYGIADLREAAAYLQHPVLGPRLVAISRALLAHSPGRTAREIMGSPDDLKVRSCMTLFSLVDGADPIFIEVLERFFHGQQDEKTMGLLVN